MLHLLHVQAIAVALAQVFRPQPELGQITKGVAGKTCRRRSASPQPGWAASHPEPPSFQVHRLHRHLFTATNPVVHLQAVVMHAAPLSKRCCRSTSMRDHRHAGCTRSPSTHGRGRIGRAQVAELARKVLMHHQKSHRCRANGPSSFQSSCG